MSEVEQYKERTRGMNVMENAGAYGITYFTTADVHAVAGRNKVTDAEAEELLDRISNRIHERMSDAGQAVVNAAVGRFIKERDE